MTMSGSDNYDDWETDEDEEDLLEISEDDLLSDQRNRNLVSTREVDEQSLSEAAEDFEGTPFLQLIKDVHVLRQLYGAKDPTVNDLTEEIESGLRVVMEQMKANPMGLLFEIATLDPEQLRRAQKIVNDMLEHYPEEGG
jgi:hypothetical protein